MIVKLALMTLWGPHTRKSYSYYGWNSSGAAPPYD